MKYVLDFDETLFDTQKLKEKMSAFDIDEHERTVGTLAAIREADPDLDLSELIYPDVWDFLKAHGEHCIIVSTALSRDPENNTVPELQHAFQLEKIRLSGITEFVAGKNIHVIAQESKQHVFEHIKEQLAHTDEEVVYVDDQKRYLGEAKACGFHAFRIDREGSGGGRSPEGIEKELASIRDLAELQKRLGLA